MMSENRQAAKPSDSFAVWRYIAGCCAILYGVLLAFVFVVQHVQYGMGFGSDYRLFEAVLALSAGFAVLRGSSARLLILACTVKILMNPANVWFALGMLTGTFQYATGVSLNSLILFLSTMLPYAGLLAALVADPLTYRAAKILRTWPDTERA